MKRLPALLLFLIPLNLFSVESETAALKELITITKKNLEEEERLLKELTQFQQWKESFVAEPENAKLASRLVRAAMSLEQAIAPGHFTHLLSKELLEEIHFFASLGKK